MISRRRLMVALGATSLAECAYANLFTNRSEKTELDGPRLRVTSPIPLRNLSGERPRVLKGMYAIDEWIPLTRAGSTLPFRVALVDATPASVTIRGHVGNSSGVGSGVDYVVAFQVAELAAGGFSIDLKVSSRSTYQSGLVGKYDIPDFQPLDAIEFFKSGIGFMTFTVESPYSVESLIANFQRLAQGRSTPIRMGEKVFQSSYRLPFGDKTMQFVLEAYPYRNGAKGLITANVPAFETSPGVIDFGALNAEAARMLNKIAND